MDRFAILCQKARKWGGQIVVLHEHDFAELQDVSEAPFTHHNLAIDYRKKKIYTSSDPTWKATWNELVHDMGHVFASLRPPRDASEFPFFGWEYALARELRGVGEWMTGNRDYGVDPTTDFGDLSRVEARAVLKERLAYARAHGLLDRRGRARAIR